MARMTRTIISIPKEEKRWLDEFGKRHRMSSAEVMRRALRAFRGRRVDGTDARMSSIGEDRRAYGSPLPSDLMDMAELRRRAAAAAGRFASGISDLSAEHDKYLAEDLTEDKAEKGREAPDRSKKSGGRR